MARVMVIITAGLIALIGFASVGECMYPFPGAGSCGPRCSYVTKMVPCVKTEMVPEVQPCTTVIPVQKVEYRCQRFLVHGTPVGCPQGADPCTKCCPVPFCKVVTRNVPYVRCVPQQVPWYNVVYKPVCRRVWLPQTYKVTEYPLCH